MNRLGERGWRRRYFVALPVIAVLMGFGGGCWAGVDLEGEVEEVRRLLNQLTLGAEDLLEIDAAVARLDSDLFAERYLASVYLARLPLLPRKRLQEEMAGAALDKRLRLAQVFKVNTPERMDGMIVRAMEVIMEGKLCGLLPEIFAALEGRTLDAAFDACVGACETAAVAADTDLLKRSISSQTVVVRAGAAVALIRLAGKDAVDELKPLVQDPDDRIKLIVAHYMREQKSHECLRGYAALLMSEEFAVRWESLDALRQISGEDFKFFASADRVDRVGPAQEWMDWVVGQAAGAELDFTLDEPEKLVLFNGEDLEGWKEVKAFFRKPHDGPSGWGVEDGKLVCFGGSNGHLRTRSTYKDFVFEFEYRTPDGEGDSGVGLFLTGADKVAPPCLEVQIMNGHAGDLYAVGGFQATGADGEPIKYRAERIADPKEEKDAWNRMEITVRAGAVAVKINGKIVNRVGGCPEGETRLTLLNQSTRVEFRGIVLSPLE